MSNLSSSGPSRMVFEPSKFVFIQTHIPRATYLLTMTKPSSGVFPIAIREALYRLTSYILCLQFRNAFATHFSPHQFKIATKGERETIIHGIQCTLDLHPN
jgi:hypothetical protein